jgi:hypothetical protein
MDFWFSACGSWACACAPGLRFPSLRFPSLRQALAQPVTSYLSATYEK